MVLPSVSMKHLLILAVHLLATIAKLVRPDGVRAVVAESLLLKHQLLISSRARRRREVIGAPARRGRRRNSSTRSSRSNAATPALAVTRVWNQFAQHLQPQIGQSTAKLPSRRHV